MIKSNIPSNLRKSFSISRVFECCIPLGALIGLPVMNRDSKQIATFLLQKVILPVPNPGQNIPATRWVRGLCDHQSRGHTSSGSSPPPLPVIPAEQKIQVAHPYRGGTDLGSGWLGVAASHVSCRVLARMKLRLDLHGTVPHPYGHDSQLTPMDLFGHARFCHQKYI
jgi:hypothetical protein